jgi:hypothetical protein
MPKKPSARKTVTAISHQEDRRTNIPTAEFQSVVDDETKTPKPYKYPRNTDLDPQLVWRGKDEQDWSAVPRLTAGPMKNKSIFLPTLTASPKGWTKPNSTATTRTGPTA